MNLPIPEYFDIHSHLCFPDFDIDREEIILKMNNNKIATISVGVDFESSKKEVKLANKHENVFACIGQHPEDWKDNQAFDERLINLARDERAVAIGECGLDYFHLEGDIKTIKKIQKEIFEAQIDLAYKVDKPLMLHVRPSNKITYDAYFDTLDILETHSKTFGDKLRGNAHFFVGNLEVLKRFLNIGFTVSFAGVITFAKEYDDYIKYSPLNMIMSETDAPFVTPVPNRGKRNSPLYVPEVVKKIAEIRNEPLEIVKKTIAHNACRFFCIPV